MLKFWLKLYSDGRLVGDAVCDCCESFPSEAVLLDGLKNCCYQLDIPNPIVLKKHVKDICEYSLTRFMPSDFPESVDFEKADVNIFDDAKTKKKF